MAETVKRFRETGAWAVLLVGVGYVVMSLVRWGWLLQHRTTLGEASRIIGGSSLSVVMVLAVVAVVLSCVLVKPVTTHARRLVRLGALLVSLAALLEAVFLVLGLFGPRNGGFFGIALEVVGGLLEISLKVIGAQVLWRAASSAPEPEQNEVAKPADPRPVTPPVVAASWDASEAAGAVWTRAGDAASGAAASTWGHPGQQSSGWNVAPELSEDPLAAVEAPPARAPQGPWATAGQLAQGEEPPAPATAAEEPGNGVNWTPAPRQG